MRAARPPPAACRRRLQSARLLLGEGGKVLASTIQENAPMMEALLGVRPQRFLPSIPHLVRSPTGLSAVRPCTARSRGRFEAGPALRATGACLDRSPAALPLAPAGKAEEAGERGRVWLL